MVRAVLKAKAIFDCFGADATAFTIEEFAVRSKMPRATASRVVKTMEQCGFLMPFGKQYSLSPKIIRLAGLVQSNLGICDVARPILSDVARAARETVTLNTRSRHERIVADVVQNQAPLMSVVRQGEHIPLLFGATGRILLAFLDESERAAIMRRLPRASDHAPVERELSRFRTQGYALTRGQRIKGLTSIAVPIFDARGKVEHCLAVTGPSVRMEAREQEFIDLLLAAGHELSMKYASVTEHAPDELARRPPREKTRRAVQKVRKG